MDKGAGVTTGDSKGEIFVYCPLLNNRDHKGYCKRKIPLKGFLNHIYREHNYSEQEEEIFGGTTLKVKQRLLNSKTSLNWNWKDLPRPHIIYFSSDNYLLLVADRKYSKIFWWVYHVCPEFTKSLVELSVQSLDGLKKSETFMGRTYYIKKKPTQIKRAGGHLTLTLDQLRSILGCGIKTKGYLEFEILIELLELKIGNTAENGTLVAPEGIEKAGFQSFRTEGQEYVGILPPQPPKLYWTRKYYPENITIAFALNNNDGAGVCLDWRKRVFYSARSCVANVSRGPFWDILLKTSFEERLSRTFRFLLKAFGDVFQWNAYPSVVRVIYNGILTQKEMHEYLTYFNMYLGANLCQVLFDTNLKGESFEIQAVRALLSDDGNSGRRRCDSILLKEGFVRGSLFFQNPPIYNFGEIWHCNVMVHNYAFSVCNFFQ